MSNVDESKPQGQTADEDEAKDLGLHADEAAFAQEDSRGGVDLLNALSENFKTHLDKAMGEMQKHNKRDFENMLSVMQQESAKRSALEQRLYSQLLLQNEAMAAMELKLLRLEAKVERREAAIRQQQHQQQPIHHQQQQQQPLQQRSHHPHPFPQSVNRLPIFTTINESTVEITSTSNRSASDSITIPEETPPNLAVISSGASLASGVTAGSFLNDDGVDDDDDDEENGSDNGSDTFESDSGNPREVDESDRHASQQSTPTQGSRPRVSVGENGTLESILLNPMVGETNVGLSVRATRGQDTDGNSSLATSVTNSTAANTITTSRGDGSTVNVRRILPDEQSEVEINTPARRGRSTVAAQDIDSNPREEPRSRSQSPLTVATHASDNFSFASASTVGTSIRSSVAVAPRSAYGRRALAVNQAMANANLPTESRPLADRVVSFTPNLTNLPAPQYGGEAADSITMPDELDTFSEVADTFANSARVWREEYEQRLDALHKRWSAE